MEEKDQLVVVLGAVVEVKVTAVLVSKLPQNTSETWPVKNNAIEATNWTWH